ncbi:hypothetical protein DVH24_042390 [Malus domestica]|uniref:Uncharacterized protein n=1 Tax=Malus domestica TaxID=3750 RepID=A0A498IXZ5_MALDO|nr:hypothetical protein DVH24_042390 [Malus domestica]
MPNHDKDWYKDILVVKGEWEGDIFGDRVQNTPSVDLNLNNNIKYVRPCFPHLIGRAFEILLVEHRD